MLCQLGTLLRCIQVEDETGVASQPTGKRPVREVRHVGDSLPLDHRETKYRAAQFKDNSGYVSSVHICIDIHTHSALPPYDII